MGDGLGGRGLMGTNGTEGNGEFVVDRMNVPQEGANDALDALDDRIVKRRAGIRLHGVPSLGAIQYGGIIVRRELGLGGKRVVVMSEDLGDVALHGYTASAFGVVPVKVHACELGSLPVLGDGVMLLKDVAEVQGVALTNVFDAEIVNYEGEEDGEPLVEP